MSEISILSNQYKKLVDTSDRVNNSVIVYKKKHMLSKQDAQRKYPKLTITQEDVELARSILIPFLTNLKQILEEDRKDSDFIPLIVLEDYKKKLEANQFQKEDLMTLISIVTDDKNITEEDISMLDSIMTVLDNERSMLFRKLRTARG